MCCIVSACALVCSSVVSSFSMTGNSFIHEPLVRISHLLGKYANLGSFGKYTNNPIKIKKPRTTAGLFEIGYVVKTLLLHLLQLYNLLLAVEGAVAF